MLFSCINELHHKNFYGGHLNPGLYKIHHCMYKIQGACMEVGASLEKHCIHKIFFLTFSVGGNHFTEKGKAQLQQAVRDRGPDFVKLSLSLSFY